MTSKRKIWLGVGAFVVAGTGAIGTNSLPAAPTSAAADSARLPSRLAASTAIPRARSDRFVVAQHADHGTDPAKDPGGGGEGGDEQKGLEDLPPDLAFAIRLALLRGHLLVGDQLVQQQQWNAALPHFLHPTEEIYADLKDHLADYKVAPFEDALKKLADLVKAKKPADYARALKAVHDALAPAEAGLKEKQAEDWPGFVVQAAIESIKTAAGEYENAIVGGRIAKPVEYQDARGFILEGDRLIESVAAGLEKKDAAALKALRARLADLKKVFPTAVPPRMPVKDHGAMLALVSRVELAASRLM
jgi:hypothetical protein